MRRRKEEYDYYYVRIAGGPKTKKSKKKKKEKPTGVKEKPNLQDGLLVLMLATLCTAASL